jgi:hypothetical protein
MDEHPEDQVVRSKSEQFLFAGFAVGEGVSNFLRTDAGRYLQGVAEQEIGEAVHVFLGQVDARRSIEQIAGAHAQAQKARKAFIWMLEAIQAGEAAEYQLRELDDMERR